MIILEVNILEIRKINYQGRRKKTKNLSSDCGMTSVEDKKLMIILTCFST